MRNIKPVIVPIFTLISLLILTISIFIFDLSHFLIPSYEFRKFYLYATLYSFIAVLISVLIWFRTRNHTKSMIPYGLQFSLGALWLIDGILQMQPQMPYEFLTLVIYPSISGIPNASISNFLMIGYNTWLLHPYQFNALSGALQIFIGVSLIIIRSEKVLKFISIISFGWALIIWIFGEGIGGIPHHGISYLDGYPGSALIYAFMSVPFFIEKTRIPKNIHNYFDFVLILFLLTSSIIQALPGNGFWAYGSLAGIPFNLAFNQGEPLILVNILNAIYPIIAIYGFYFNIIFILAPIALAIAIFGKQRLSYLISAIFLLPIWIIFQALGIFVNPATDPNTLLPILLILLYVYLLPIQSADEISIMENKIT